MVSKPPNQEMSSFDYKMNNILNVVRSGSNTCFLLGDYNINIFDYVSHAQTVQFVDMLPRNGFLPLISRPPRVTAASATLIDNVLPMILVI